MVVLNGYLLLRLLATCRPAAVCPAAPAMGRKHPRRKGLRSIIERELENERGGMSIDTFRHHGAEPLRSRIARLGDNRRVLMRQAVGSLSA